MIPLKLIASHLWGSHEHLSRGGRLVAQDYFPLSCTCMSSRAQLVVHHRTGVSGCPRGDWQ